MLHVLPPASNVSFWLTTASRQPACIPFTERLIGAQRAPDIPLSGGSVMLWALAATEMADVSGVFPRRSIASAAVSGNGNVGNSTATAIIARLPFVPRVENWRHTAA